MALREPLTHYDLPPILQRELKIQRTCWQQRAVNAVLTILLIVLMLAIMTLPFLTKVGK